MLISRMTSVEDATAILRRFQENHYFINEQALSNLVEVTLVPRFLHYERNEY